jgi:phosphatidylethanolamine-binding protein (PEBP) family uncharacterized protein
MPKIDVNQVAEILKRNELEPALLRQIVEEMNMLVQPEVDEEKPPAVKKQFAVIVSDPNGDLPKHDFVGWVVQIPENESVASSLERVHRAVYEFNTTKKGRLMPAKTVGEAMEHVSAKHFKEANIWVKTKVPVLLVKSDNKIPADEAKGKDARRGRLE